MASSGSRGYHESSRGFPERGSWLRALGDSLWKGIGTIRAPGELPKEGVGTMRALGDSLCEGVGTIKALGDSLWDPMGGCWQGPPT